MSLQAMTNAGIVENPLVFTPFVFQNIVSGAPLPPGSFFRITEDGSRRITEDGNIRVTE